MSLKKANHTTTPDGATAVNTAVAASAEATTTGSTAPMLSGTKPIARNQDLHEQAVNRTRTHQAKDAKVRRGLRKLDLNAYYDAINNRWFGGKLPKDVTVVWKTEKQINKERRLRTTELLGYCHFTKNLEQRIVINIDRAVANPKDLLSTMAHEAIHTGMPLGDELLRKSAYGKTTNTQHGEKFGAECRRINALLGYKLFSDRECSYGMAGKKWAEDNVVVECDDYIWTGTRGLETAPSCDHKCTKREMRAHKMWHKRQYEAWYEKFGEAHSAYEEFSMKLFEEKGIWDDDQAWSLYQVKLASIESEEAGE